MTRLRRLGKWLAALPSAIAGSLDGGDVAFLAGLGFCCYGISMVHIPAAYITGGAVLMGYSYMPHLVSFTCAIRAAGKGSAK